MEWNVNGRLTRPRAVSGHAKRVGVARRCRSNNSFEDEDEDDDEECVVVVVVVVVLVVGGTSRRTSRARGPDTRMTATPARPGAEERAKMVSSCATSPPDNGNLW